MIKIKFCLFFYFVCVGIQAQNTWLLLATEGDVKNVLYKNKEKILVKKLWAGDTLRRTRYIHIPEKSYIALAHLETGKITEINQQGVYKLEDVLAGKDSSNFAFSNAFGISIPKLSHANRELPSELMAKYEPVMGSVERCRCGGVPDLVKPLFPTYEAGLEKNRNPCMYVLKDKIRIQILLDTTVLRKIPTYPLWKSYNVEIYNFRNKKIHTATISLDSSQKAVFELDFQKLNNPSNDNYYTLTVHGVGDNVPLKERTQWCLEKVPNKYTPSERLPTYEYILALEEKLKLHPTAIGYVLTAMLYEQEFLFIESAIAYQKALSLQPRVIAYQNLYHNFLYDNYFIISMNKDKAPIFFARKTLPENIKGNKKTPPKK